jgi:hypothetical protein
VRGGLTACTTKHIHDIDVASDDIARNAMPSIKHLAEARHHLGRGEVALAQYIAGPAAFDPVGVQRAALTWRDAVQPRALDHPPDPGESLGLAPHLVLGRRVREGREASADAMLEGVAARERVRLVRPAPVVNCLPVHPVTPVVVHLCDRRVDVDLVEAWPAEARLCAASRFVNRARMRPPEGDAAPRARVHARRQSATA